MLGAKDGSYINEITICVHDVHKMGEIPHDGGWIGNDAHLVR